MKKFIAVCTLLICLLMLVSCAGKVQHIEVPRDDDTGPSSLQNTPGNPSEENDVTSESVLKATVGIRNDERLILYTNDAGGLYSLDLSSVELIDCNDEDVKAGLEIEIVYSGAIMETYPSQLGALKTLRIIGGEQDDICSMYANVAQSLWTEDPGLNGPICALEIKDNTISENQKRVVAYELQNRLGIETSVILSTREELEKEGVINKEELYFNNGALITISMDKETRTDDSFKFSAQKWASGTGAIFWFDCKAERNDGVWKYEFGGFAIS